MEFGRSFWTGMASGVGLCVVVALVASALTHRPAAGGAETSQASPTAAAVPGAERNEIAAQLRSALAVSVDGAGYDPGALADQVLMLEAKGFSRDESISTVQGFAAGGVTPARIGDFAFAVGTLAKVKGIDLVAMGQKVTSGVTRGYEACAELDGELDFLTVDQRDQIRKDFDAGEAVNARAECFDALRARAQAAASA